MAQPAAMDASPQELQDQILETLMAVSTERDKVKYRLVNKAFDRAVMHNFTSRSSTTSRPRPGPPDAKLPAPIYSLAFVRKCLEHALASTDKGSNWSNLRAHLERCCDAVRKSSTLPSEADAARVWQIATELAAYATYQRWEDERLGVTLPQEPVDDEAQLEADVLVLGAALGDVQAAAVRFQHLARREPVYERDMPAPRDTQPLGHSNLAFVAPCGAVLGHPTVAAAYTGTMEQVRDAVPDFNAPLHPHAMRTSQMLSAALHGRQRAVIYQLCGEDPQNPRPPDVEVRLRLWCVDDRVLRDMLGCQDPAMADLLVARYTNPDMDQHSRRKLANNLIAARGPVMLRWATQHPVMHEDIAHVIMTITAAAQARQPTTIVAFLRAHGHLIETQDLRGVFEGAIAHDDVPLLRLLFDERAELRTYTGLLSAFATEGNILYRAAMRGSTGILQACLDLYGPLQGPVDVAFALRQAVAHGHPATVRFLLAQGADPRALFYLGFPMHPACYCAARVARRPSRSGTIRKMVAAKVEELGGAEERAMIMGETDLAAVMDVFPVYKWEGALEWQQMSVADVRTRLVPSLVDRDDSDPLID